MRMFVRLFVPLVLFVSLAAGQDNAWKLDKSHSSIAFSIPHMVISEVHGRFDDFNVTFTSPGDNLNNASVTATIDVKSIDTGSEGRDKELRSANFFDVQKYPEIRFTSTSFKNVGGNAYDINGDLTIRDVTKNVTFKAEHRGTIKTQRGSISAWSVSLKIDRFDYGLAWNKVLETGGLVAGETVTITMNLEFRGS